VSPGTRQDLGGPDVVTLGEPLVQLSPPSGRRLPATDSLEAHAAGADAAVAAASLCGRQVTPVPSLPVFVVEAVGAGDAFAAGYPSSPLAGTDERTALRAGHLFAAHALLSVADQVEPPPPDPLADAADRDDAWWGGADRLQHPHLRSKGHPVVGGRPQSRRAVEPEEV